MYYNTIVMNLDSRDVIRKADFSTVDAWDEYRNLVFKVQAALGAWYADGTKEAQDKFYAALKLLYAFIDGHDGTPKEKRYVPQDAETELRRYSFMAACVKTRKIDTEESVAFYDKNIAPINKEYMMAGLLHLSDKEKAAIRERLEKAKKEWNAKKAVRKQLEPLAEVTFRKHFETALAMAIKGGTMETVEERRARQLEEKAAKAAAKAKLEAEMGMKKAEGKKSKKAAYALRYKQKANHKGVVMQWLCLFICPLAKIARKEMKCNGGTFADEKSNWSF